MCIAIITTAHPDYPFILLNNRDEYLRRPTAPLQWWPEPAHAHVLGGYDLHRPAHGTWLGLTRDGRLAVLTNFREEAAEPGALVQGARSRGAIVNGWLTPPPPSSGASADGGEGKKDGAVGESPEAFAARLLREGVRDIGGFTVVYGRVQDVISPRQKQQRRGQKAEAEAEKEEPCSCHCSMPNGEAPAEEADAAEAEAKGLAVLSNRTPDAAGLAWLAQRPGSTVALSNARFGDRSWPKVSAGEAATAAAVAASVAAGPEPRAALLDRLLAVLSADTMPRQRAGESWEVYLRQLRHSIFIPPIGDAATEAARPADELAAARSMEAQPVPADATSGVYGTQKQSVVLVNWRGHVTFMERSLFDEEGRPVEKGKGDRLVEFDIEPW